jgi:hypothetical protein
MLLAHAYVSPEGRALPRSPPRARHPKATALIVVCSELTENLGQSMTALREKFIER